MFCGGATGTRGPGHRTRNAHIIVYLEFNRNIHNTYISKCPEEGNRMNNNAAAWALAFLFGVGSKFMVASTDRTLHYVFAYITDCGVTESGIIDGKIPAPYHLLYAGAETFCFPFIFLCVFFCFCSFRLVQFRGLFAFNICIYCNAIPVEK